MLNNQTLMDHWTGVKTNTVHTTTIDPLETDKSDNVYPQAKFQLMKEPNRTFHPAAIVRATILMMTLSNRNIFNVTGPLCGEFTGHLWIPFTKASDTELWCFLWSAPEQTVD